MRILVKFPIRYRREKFFQTLDRYIATADDLLNITFVITCDSDDAEMNCEAARAEFEKRKHQNGQIYVHYGEHKTKIEACNADIPPEGWDILLLASDDMIPKMQGWDRIIRDRMQQYYPDLDGVLHFWDGHNKDQINTLSIFGRKWYDRFGYVYNPLYKTMYCDTEFTDVARMLNRVTYFNEVIIEHLHPYSGAIPFDKLYLRNNNCADDAAMYRRRRAKNFFLKTTLIKQPGRFGDILICLPIAKHYHDQNHVVYWYCPKEYHSLFRNIDYAIPTDQEIPADNVIDLSFGFGGEIEAWWQSNKHLFDSFVTAKYYLAGVNIAERWKLKFNRDRIKEYKLIDLLHCQGRIGLHNTLTHEQTHCGRFINLDLPNKVEFTQIADFNVFDWYGVIQASEEIHCIDSALSNFIEALPEFRYKRKTIYLSQREDNHYLRSIYKNNWIIK